MALLSINADDPVPEARLRASLAALPPGRPVVIMIHGFKFCPSRPATSPHTHILSERPSRSCWKARSWPRHLALTGDRGLGIGFGWPARGTIWAVWDRIPAAARALAATLAALHRIDRGRPVHLVAHSLGARVALLALADLPPGAVERIILISAASFLPEARGALATPAGRRAEIFSIRGRENTLFDLLLRAAFPLGGPTLGRGGPDVRNWLDLPLDRPQALASLRLLGHRIAAPRARICHWSGYLRPGIFGLYRALLHRPAETPLPLLRHHLAAPSPARPLLCPAFESGAAS